MGSNYGKKMSVCPKCGYICSDFTYGKCNLCKIDVVETEITFKQFSAYSEQEKQKWQDKIIMDYVKHNPLYNESLFNLRVLRQAKCKNKEANINEISDKISRQYIELCSKYKKPMVGSKVTAKGTAEHECWVANETFYMISTWDRVKWMIENNTYKSAEEHTFEDFVHFESILLSQIHHFQREGEVYTETKISGGGGGGSSITGAVVGGLIAGGVGAIIGSRKQTDSIKSETIRHDSREVILYYYETPTSKALTALHFESESYNGLIMTIPEKEFSAVMSKEQKLSARFATGENAQSVTDKIRELAKLRDDGIITEEEFAEKKKELLSQI